MTDILIRAKKEKVEHKLKKNCPDAEYCYWTGVHPKKLSGKASDRVMFTDGINVYAEGTIYCENQIDGLVFAPLREVDYPQPKKAPTRGFTYVE